MHSTSKPTSHLFRISTDISDWVTPHLGVGNGYRFMLSGKDDAGRQIHLKNLACHTSHTDRVTHQKWPFDQDENACGKVRQHVFDRKAHDKAGHAQTGDEWGHVKSQVPGNKGDQYQPKEDLDAALA